MTAAEFHSARLLIRPLNAADRELYCSLFSDSQTMRHIGAAWTRGEAEQAFAGALRAMRTDPPRGLFYALVLRAGGDALGICSLQNFEWQERQTELGMMLRPAGRAQGYATEALVAVLSHIFHVLALEEVWVRFAADHAVAERTALSGGLVRDAEAGAPRFPGLCRWSARRSSWQAPSPRNPPGS